MSDRKLATVRKIKELKLIQGADKIECAVVDGWELVVKKGEFQVGDLAVYCEIDSLLPDKPEFAFMKDRKFKVKTIKLRGQVSQGILFPVTILPRDYVYTEGSDVTEVLGVKNYKELEEVKDPVETKKQNSFVKFLMSNRITRPLGRFILSLTKAEKGSFPSFVIKTDEERIQNNPRFLNNVTCVTVTEKLDGQSATFFVKKNKLGFKQFGVCSRNLWLKTPYKCNWWDMAFKYDIEKKLKKLPYELYIQGEICGPSIQGNKYKLQELELFLFNAYHLTDKYYLNRYQLEELAQTLGCRIVPIPARENMIINKKLINGKDISVQELIDLSKGFSQINTNTIREGIVIREGLDELMTTKNSVKVINPDFLLKNDE